MANCFRYIVASVMFLGALLITGLGNYPARDNLAQFPGQSEKEWQLDDSSGVQVWIALNSTVGTPPLRRNIYLLLGKEYFRREDLAKVFAYFSQKYGDPVWLYIQVFSDKTTLRQ